MTTTLLTTGLACVIAAIIGGGLKAFEIEIPVIQSFDRQVVLGLFGAALITTAYVIHTQQPKPSQFSYQSLEKSPSTPTFGNTASTPSLGKSTSPPDRIMTEDVDPLMERTLAGTEWKVDQRY